MILVKSMYDLSECEVGVRWMYKRVSLSKKNSQHIIYYPIIFFEIDILLLGYKKLNS